MVRPSPHRMLRAIMMVVAGAVAGMWPQAAQAQDLIFADGFESGDLAAWTVPAPVLPSVAVAEASVAVLEGDGTVEILVSVEGENVSGIVVQWTAEGGTATGGSDFEPVAGILNIAAGATTETIFVNLVDDLLVEPDEVFTVTLGNPVNATLDPLSSCEVTIGDDDVYPEVAFVADQFTVSESDGSAVLPVALSWSYPADVTFGFSIAGNTATAGEDVEATGGTLTIPAGGTEAEIQVIVVDDALHEGDESFSVSLIDPQGAVIGIPGEAVVVIGDDDPEPSVRFSTASLEVNEAVGSFDILVELTGVSGLDVSIGLSAVDGTAVHGDDFELSGDSLLIGAGATTASGSVTIVDDGVIEGDEDFQIVIENPSGASLGTPAAMTITVVDDEPVPVITSPLAGTFFYDGDVFDVDAIASYVPSGFAIWLAVLADNGGDPMPAVAVSNELSTSFTASDTDTAYVVRLVVATPEAMPPDVQLRGPGLPCVFGETGFGCASTELRMHASEYWHIRGFETSYVFPDGVMLRWGRPEQPPLERSSDGGATWQRIDDYESPLHDYFFVDRNVDQGETYHYRIPLLPGEVYLGRTDQSPGLPVVIPEWTAPRVLPEFASVTWGCPTAAEPTLCVGTLRVLLSAEGGESLAGATIRVFLNEETFQQKNGIGEDAYIKWPDNLNHFRGRDAPGCVVRAASPDFEITVPVGEDTAEVSLPGVRFGANSLRFEIEASDGGISERAILVPLHSTPLQGAYSSKYSTFKPVLFGDVIAATEFQIRGVGPASRYSPDCEDGDRTYLFVKDWDDDSVYANLIVVDGQEQAYVGTDGEGTWATAPMALSDGEYGMYRRAVSAQFYAYGSVGRIIENETGGIATDELATYVYCSTQSSTTPITVDSAAADLAPHLDQVVPEVLVDSADPEALGVVSFRITDADHDVSLEAVTVRNLSLESPASSPAFYASDQVRSEGNWGWFVAELAMVRGENLFEFCAEDETGHLLGTVQEPCVTAAVMRVSPLVNARVTEPESGTITAPPGALVQLDGSGSVFPEGGVALWTTGAQNLAYFPWYSTSTMTPTSDPGDLRTNIFMFEGSYWSYKARLVVAASLLDLPEDLWPDDGSLPCQRGEGEGRCDSVDVWLHNTCSVSPVSVFTAVAEPTSGLRFGPFDPVTFRAVVQADEPENFAYRWVVFASDDQWLQWPLVTVGNNDDGEGFSTLNRELVVTAAEAGLPMGDYQLVVEARDPASGCAYPLWKRGRSAPVTLSFGHSLDGIAPGKVVEGDAFRVYSRTMAERLEIGETAKVIIDDDPDLYDDQLFEFTVGISEGGFFRLTADPGFMSAGDGTTYFIRLAENSSWDGLSAVAELRVEPAGTEEIPIAALDEETGLCIGGYQINGAECAQPILPGQTIGGVWAESLDEDFFYFFAGAGTEVRITLDAVDDDLPPERLGKPEPELWLMRPDELIVAAAGPGSVGDARISVEHVLSMSGKYLIAVRSTGGPSEYVVTLEKTAEGGNGEPAFGHTRSTVYLSTSTSPLAFFRLSVLDGFGNPFGAAPVVWEEGEDCGDGSFCATGPIEVVRSESRGDLAYTPDSDPGGVRMWRPRLDPIVVSGGGKLLGGRKRVIASPGDDPVLGRLGAAGRGTSGSLLPDLETAVAIREQFELEERLRGARNHTKDGPFCDDAVLSCSGDGDLVFRAARLPLLPDEELVGLSLEVLDGGQAVDELVGVEVVTGVPLTVSATATVRDAQGEEREIELTEAVGMSVTEGHGAALSQAGQTCDSLAVVPGVFDYEVGRKAIMRFTHIDEEQRACCWLPMEWIDATLVAEIEVPDGSGGTARVAMRTETRVASIPEPAAACDIRPVPAGPFPGGIPQLAGKSPDAAQAGVDETSFPVGSVYVVDQCGNIKRRETGDPVPSVTAISPLDPKLWGEVRETERRWQWDVYLHSTNAFTENQTDHFYIPDGVYAMTVGIDDPEACQVPVQRDLVFDYLAGRPTVRLVWSQGGYEPIDPGAFAGFPLMHPGGEGVMAWRVRPCDSNTFRHGGTIYQDVPIRLYVARRWVTWDRDGNLIEHYPKVDDAVLCTGQAFVHHVKSPYEFSQWTTCDTVHVGEVVVSASTEPVWWEDDFTGPIGLSAGILETPDTADIYVLVAEPLDEAFRRGESWRMDPALVRGSANSGSPIKEFHVLNREPPPDLSCQTCGDCAGGDIGLRNGNARYTDADPLPLLPAPLTSRTCDSQNPENGVFGTGWTSAFDAEAMVFAGSSSGARKASSVLQVYLTTEDNRVFAFDSTDGGSFLQSWPSSGTPHRLIDTGTGYALYLNGDPYIRYYRDSDGRLEKLIEVVGGREYTIVYDGATGTPAEVLDSVSGSIASFAAVDGRITGITVGGDTTTYEYGDDTTLDGVTAASASWRTYAYNEDLQLTEATDGDGRVLRSLAYRDGWAVGTVSARQSITDIEWAADGPRAPAVGETVVRTDSAEGGSTYYYMRRVSGRQRVVEVVGECACSGNDRVYAYDAFGNVVLEQDGRGYITHRSYLGDGRPELEEAGLHLAGCNPADFPEDPSACRLTPDELAMVNPAYLEAAETTDTGWYAYDDIDWPTRPTQECRPSVLQLEGQIDRTACRTTTYHQASGQWATITETGWTGLTAEEAVFETHTSTRTFYGGTFVTPAFDPGGAFDPSWLVEPQPENLVRSSDGPRDDVSDARLFVYYPSVEVESVPVPENWRGRLAAEMDPLGYITLYEDYDEWGNARRIAGPTGTVTERTFDDYGRVLTSTLVAGEGCDSFVDPLCSENLTTTTTYEPGGGPLASVTPPGGTVSRYAYDDLGRVLTTDRGPSFAEMRERLANHYDPVTGLKTRDSRLGDDGGTWVERSRTDYDHYLTGQLIRVERPRFAGDGSPSEEHYTYDVAGRMETLQDANHSAANVAYRYDGQGRLKTVRQLLDLATNQWAETTYRYDGNGNLTGVTDAEGNTTTYVVDDFARTTRIESPVTGVTDMAYDAAGNPVTRSDARGVTATSIFDANGRVTDVAYDDGGAVESLSFGYDAAGRRTSAGSPEVGQTFTYSRRGLVLTAAQTVNGTTHAASFSYDLDGALESVTYPSGRVVRFDTDYAGRPTTITSTASGGGTEVTVAENLEYLPFGPASHLELGPVAGRVVEERAHDWQYRRTAQTAESPGATDLLDLEYDYDAAGNLVNRTDHLGDRSAGYGYDDLSRLTSASWTGADRVYEYDAIGNIERLGVDEGLPGAGEVLFGYPTNSAGGNSAILESTETRQGGAPLSSYAVASDDVGNVTSDGLSTFDYDAQNHLGSRTLQGATIENAYSADGRLARSERSDTGVATVIVLDPAGRRLAKLEDGVWRDYLYLGDQLLAYFDDGADEPTLVLADHIGLPMMAVDGSAAVVWQAQTEPYGELRGQVSLGADPGLRYPGQWQDELELEASCDGDTCTMPGPLEDSFSLFENGYRWYVPRWGRYGQADPIGLEGGSDLFSYARRNPHSYIDQNGLQVGSGISDLDSYWHFGNNSADFGNENPCNGYRKFSGSLCCRSGSLGVDPYIGKANVICRSFLKRYRFSLASICVAKCLSSKEGQTTKLISCAQRNAKRLNDHVICYAQCQFVPYLLFPEGGFKVGVGMLGIDYYNEVVKPSVVMLP